MPTAPIVDGIQNPLPFNDRHAWENAFYECLQQRVLQGYTGQRENAIRVQTFQGMWVQHGESLYEPRDKDARIQGVRRAM